MQIKFILFEVHMKPSSNSYKKGVQKVEIGENTSFYPKGKYTLDQAYRDHETLSFWRL